MSSIKEIEFVKQLRRKIYTTKLNPNEVLSEFHFYFLLSYRTSQSTLKAITKSLNREKKTMYLYLCMRCQRDSSYCAEFSFLKFQYFNHFFPFF